MNRDDIIRMAGEAGFETLMPSEHIHGTGGVYVGDDDIAGMLERFATLVATAEREACAALLDANAKNCHEGSITYSVLKSNAAAIRERKAGL